MDWFTPDIGAFYGLARRWNEDATLAGSDTILAGMSDVPAGDENPVEPPQTTPHADRPLLVIPDSRGRVRCWNYLRRQEYWRDALALCAASTPNEYLDYLKERHVRFLVTGEKRVDYRRALEELWEQFGVKVVRVDSGGTLNGVLLREKLVDEVSVLIHPALVGGLTPRQIFRAPDLTAADQVLALKLVHFEKLDGDLVWLVYEVTG